jgi:kynurenine/2-aminoadipate aminotransferase
LWLTQVLFVPGSSFVAHSPKSSWVRAAFSTASPEQIDTALERLGTALRALKRV